MKKTVFIAFCSFFAFLSAFPLFCADSTVEATSRINWITRNFTSDISLDTQKLKLQMPSGKKKASATIKSKMPQLIQPALLSLYTDASYNLADFVISEDLTLDEVYNFIMGGYKTPDVFSQNLKNLNTTNTLNVNEIGKLLIKHIRAYLPEEPIETVPSRAYSGIIIDARGSLPVHGEYVKSKTAACFFPVIRDERMNTIFERSEGNPAVIQESGLVCYDTSEKSQNVKDRVGLDPLYIKAREVFGRNRTDPIISRKDALKILTVPENIRLLEECKVAVLLDDDQLVYTVSVPEKTEIYYVKYEAAKQYFYENKVPDVTVTDSIDGILFSVNLNFYPDSAQLLPGENERIAMIAEQLKELLIDDGYTILVEGHTADVGKPVGQLNLSIERTRTVMNALIEEGLPSELFTYRGYGGTMPVATNATEEGRAQNRRVDITARPRATYIQRDW